MAEQADKEGTKTERQETAFKSSSNGSMSPPTTLPVRTIPASIQVPATLPVSTPQEGGVADVVADSTENQSNGKKAEELNPLEVDAFDWDDFNNRFSEAMALASEKEVEILKSYERLSSYFATWAMSASEHDEDRARKRLRTRETYIKNTERSFKEKKDHYLQVVEAFKQALALLEG